MLFRSNEIEVDISAMEVGDTIRVDMVALPAGVTAVDDPEAAVATAMVTRSTLEAMRADEAEEAAEDGEAPADDEGDD